MKSYNLLTVLQRPMDGFEIRTEVPWSRLRQAYGFLPAPPESKFDIEFLLYVRSLQQMKGSLNRELDPEQGVEPTLKRKAAYWSGYSKAHVKQGSLDL